MPNTLTYRTLLPLLLTWLTAFSAKANKIPIHGDWVFEENIGQFSGLSRQDIPYVGMDGNVNLYFYRDRVRFVFSHTTGEGISEAKGAAAPHERFGKDEAPKKTHTEYETVDMLFAGANPAPRISAEKQTEFRKNYYLSHCPDGITDVRTYEKITYHDLYPYIDFVIYTRAHGLKYEFIVRPGGNPDAIRMSWPGAAITYQKDEIKYTNKLGAIRETGLYTYLSSGKKVQSGFSLEKGNVGFDIASHPKNETLVIDPILEWSTYYGGSGSDGVYSLETDQNGNVYMTGVTQSADRIASPDAWQKTYNGADDLFIGKFDKDGKRIWSTYYGGKDWERFVAMAVTPKGTIYIAGETKSTDVIATAGAFRTKKMGLEDAFVSKFSTNGKLIWGTYYGGSNGDGARGIAVSNNEIYIGGYTNSTDSISTPGSHQVSRGGTAGSPTDGFLTKFDTLGKRIWSTYYGGEGTDFIMDVRIFPGGDIVVLGNTASTSNISTPGAFQEKISDDSFYRSIYGTAEGFIARFSPAGKRKFGTYFGGINSFEYFFKMALDPDGNIYPAGYSFIDDDKLATPGSFQTTPATQATTILARFDSTGKRIWCTYYGRSYSFIGDIKIDADTNIFIVGGSDPDSIITTPNTYQPHTMGKGDCYIACFTKSGARKWGTFFGADNYVDAFGVAPDKFGNLYIAGTTRGKTGIVTRDAYQQVFSPEKYDSDAFLAKFCLENCTHQTGSLSILGDTVICHKLNTTLYVKADKGARYIWRSSDSLITKDRGDTIEWTADWRRSASVTVVRIDAAGKLDSVKVTVRIEEPKADFTVPKGCAEDFTKFENKSTGAENYIWRFGDNTTSLDKDPSKLYSSGGNYTVTLIARMTKCIDSVKKTIWITPAPKVKWKATQKGDLNYLLEAADTMYSDYQWLINDTVVAAGTSVQRLFKAKGSYKVSLRATSDSGCVGTFDSVLAVGLVGINSQKQKISCTIAPNPTNGNTSLQINVAAPDLFTLEIHDLAGRSVYKISEASLHEGSNIIDLPLRQLALRKGVYICRVKTKNGGELQTKIFYE